MSSPPPPPPPFLTSLIDSIFTPGPTPSLVIATNVAFAALQLVLFLLLLATWSVHFVVLSGLCGGLWWAVNWFVGELEVERRRGAVGEGVGVRGKGVRDKGKGDDMGGGWDRDGKEGKEMESVQRRRVGVDTYTGAGSDAGSATTPKKAEGNRNGNGGGRSEISTEDEWEKVSENENEKDK